MPINSEASITRPLLVAQGVEKRFKRGVVDVQAIQSFSLEVSSGEFVSIVGPSGCGKTTLLHMVGGFESPSAGRFELNGKEITGPGADRGVLFQESTLFDWLTVEQNIAWPMRIQGKPAHEIKDKVSELLELVHLPGFRRHYPSEISGGMKQRVGLARLLAQDPAIMLMDEPFGALDAQTREIMQELLAKIWRRNRKTVLFVTHDIDEAVYLGTRVVIFTARPGKIKKNLAIDLEPGRDIEIKKSKPYRAYRDEVWDLLREEVLRTQALTQQKEAN
ncbi:MAG: ABC transporter ATP-binding protein [Burkholderiaceae bacterium]|nr:MAG: ABC transporter ATP-binding protein [Burkholderiaceae bacterium]TAM08166.1 MAG: ABC transporter ATP-binding protein [Pusillimonas sp.]